MEFQTDSQARQSTYRYSLLVCIRMQYCGLIRRPVDQYCRIPNRVTRRPDGTADLEPVGCAVCRLSFGQPQ
jgi:hypothetical protein